MAVQSDVQTLGGTSSARKGVRGLGYVLRTGPTFVLAEERTLILKHFCELKPEGLHRANISPRCNM